MEIERPRPRARPTSAPPGRLASARTRAQWVSVAVPATWQNEASPPLDSDEKEVVPTNRCESQQPVAPSSRPSSARPRRPWQQNMRPRSAQAGDARDSHLQGSSPALSSRALELQQRVEAWDLNQKQGGGIAEMLLLSQSSGEWATGEVMQQLLRNAVLLHAPSDSLSACAARSGCCWRWAADQLLREHAILRASYEGLRIALSEELGSSILQQLIDLEKRHDELLLQSRSDTNQLAWLKDCSDAREQEYRQQLLALNRAEVALVKQEQEWSKENAELKLTIRRLEQELAAVDEDAIRVLRERAEAAEAHSQEIERRMEARMREMRTQQLDLEARAMQAEEAARRVPRLRKAKTPKRMNSRQQLLTKKDKSSTMPLEQTASPVQTEHDVPDVPDGDDSFAAERKSANNRSSI